MDDRVTYGWAIIQPFVPPCRGMGEAMPIDGI